jgi:hypothetical protein
MNFMRCRSLATWRTTISMAGDDSHTKSLQ